MVGTASRKSSSLEALRGLAALVVFLGHLYVAIPRKQPWLDVLAPVFNWGTEAVILFFLLSGVVIRLSEERRPRRPSEFAFDRLLRIYPLYLFAVAMAIVAARLLAEQLSYGAIVGNVLFVQSLQGYIAPTLPTDPPLWSLSFELTFYACFALVLANRRLMRAWWVAAFVSLCTYSLPLSWPWASHFRMIFAFSAIWLSGYYLAMYRDRFRVDAGSAVAVLPLAFAWARIKFLPDFYDPFRLLGFGLFLLPLFSSAVSSSTRVIRLPAIGRVVLCVGVVALLWSQSDSLRMTKAALSAASIVGCLFGPSLLPYVRVPDALLRPLVYLGSVSYALYVVHFPIVALTFGRVQNPAIALGIVLALVLALSHLLERVLQPRLARAVRRRPLVESSPTAAPATS